MDICIKEIILFRVSSLKIKSTNNKYIHKLSIFIYTPNLNNNENSEVIMTDFFLIIYI